MFLCLLLLAACALSATPSEGSCCTKKKVGEVEYKLLKDDPSLTASYGCKGGCIYVIPEDPEPQPMWCFKPGSLQVKCLDAKPWSYSNGTGPSFWGDAYEGCNGKSQSPIDIPSPPASPTPEVTPLVMAKYDKVRIASLANKEETNEVLKDSRLSNGTLKNNGHTAQLDVIKGLPDDVGVLSGGPLEGEYKILQLHFHWGSNASLGSEHTLDGKRFPIELHIVHTKKGVKDPLNTPRGLAVTGFFFEIDSETNDALTPLVEELVNIGDYSSKVAMENSAFKVSDLLFGVAPVGVAAATTYSTYDGSLTTPGCNEVVHWINFLTPLKISASQLARFRTLDDKHGNEISDNFRPPQPLNGRVVEFYGAA